VAAALDEFITLLMGQHWRAEMQHKLPGSITQLERDAATFSAPHAPRKVFCVIRGEPRHEPPGATLTTSDDKRLIPRFAVAGSHRAPFA
jgi:hypothetical protein